nr:hydroxyethylthiazole kinase [uncultured Butyricicoccus sp.]
MDITYSASTLCDHLRANTPIIHCITNSVTINDCANAALAVGASPIMADAPEEADAVTAHAQALVLNIGQLCPRKLQAMLCSGQRANQMGIPVVLDPVGVGVSPMRTAGVQQILQTVHISILRCNRSEAACIYGIHTTGKGIDSDQTLSVSDGAALTSALAARYHCTVAMTGAVDLISDSIQTFELHGGHQMLSRVTGMGCVSSVLCAAYAAVSQEDYLTAAIAGLGSIAAAGQLAYQRAGIQGTGSFHIAVIDALSQLNTDTLQQSLLVKEVSHADIF